MCAPECVAWGTDASGGWYSEVNKRHAWWAPQQRWSEGTILAETWDPGKRVTTDLVELNVGGAKHPRDSLSHSWSQSRVTERPHTLGPVHEFR